MKCSILGANIILDFKEALLEIPFFPPTQSYIETQKIARYRQMATEQKSCPHGPVNPVS